MKNIDHKTRHFIRCRFNPVQAKLRNKISPAETKFMDLLRDLGVYFFREKGRFHFGQEWCYYDFYLPYYRIYIEIDGKEHNTSDAKKRDKIKEKYISDNQSYVARFTNEEVFAMDSLTLETIINRVAIWMQMRRKKKNRKNIDFFVSKYWDGMKAHLKQSENDMRKGNTPIDEYQEIYLYDHYIGDYYVFSNIIEAKQSISDFTLPKLYDLIYTFEYKPSPVRRYVFGRTLSECEQRVARVYY